MSTLADVAAKAGVSVATASIILNAPARATRFHAETIQRVKEVAGELQYQRGSGRRDGLSAPRSPSLARVAQAAEVSVATASIILNAPEKSGRFSEARIRHVQQIARQLGYQRNIHAGRFRTRKAETIGLVLDFLTYKHLVDIPFWMRILSGLDFAARARGYEVAIIGPHEEHSAVAHAITLFNQYRVDGLVLPAEPTQRRTRQELALYNGPLIRAFRPNARGVDAVYEDDETGVRLVLEHLLSLGHRRVAWLGPDRWPGGTGNHRRRTFLRIAKQLGLRTEEYTVEMNTAKESSESLIQASHRAARSFLGRAAKMTAVVCFNDDIALGVYRAAHDVRRAIPSQLTVTGYDDFHGLYFTPALTTVHSCIVEVGLEAATWLIERIEGRTDPQADSPLRKSIAPTLSVRASSTPIR